MITVFGATGTIATPLLATLQNRDVAFRAVTHNSKNRASLEATGYEAVVADFSAPDELERACNGAERAFLVTPASIDMRRWKANAIAAAKAAGVAHVVMCTGLGASPEARLTFGRWHSETQELLKQSGMDWTLVQPTYFMQNLLWQADNIACDGVYFDDVCGPVAWVDARDIADVAAEALTGAGHAGESYRLTGAEALDGSEVAALISDATGRKITSRALPPDAAKAAMIENGMHEEVAAAMVELASIAPKGYLAGTEPTIKAVLGRAPRRFADFISENAALLRN